VVVEYCGPDSLLGQPIYHNNLVHQEDLVGVVTGLAYTVAGGDTLDVEATYFEGKNVSFPPEIWANVMKESADGRFVVCSFQCR
jgi:ATP-dependent Lon protease